MQRGRGSVSSATSDYEDQIKHVGAFSSVSNYWAGNACNDSVQGCLNFFEVAS